MESRSFFCFDKRKSDKSSFPHPTLHFKQKIKFLSSHATLVMIFSRSCQDRLNWYEKIQYNSNGNGSLMKVTVARLLWSGTICCLALLVLHNPSHDTTMRNCTTGLSCGKRRKPQLNGKLDPICTSPIHKFVSIFPQNLNSDSVALL